MPRLKAKIKPDESPNTAPVQLLKISEACARLGCSRATLYNLMQTSELEYVRFCGHRRISESAIAKYVTAHTVASIAS